MIADPAERARLLSYLQRRVRDLLTPRLHAMFDELDTRLFELAERSRVGAQQHAYFDGMRECRRKRGDVERDFLDTILSTLRPATSGPGSLRASSMSLMAHDELEETLVLSSLAERTATRLAASLDALDRRCATLLNAMRDPLTPPRLSPQSLGTAFRAACQRLDVGIEVRLVAYALFGQHVFDALESIYGVLNRELIDAGVLPALEAPAARAPKAPSRRPPAGTAPPQAPPRRAERAPQPDPDPNASIQSLMDELRDLLIRRDPLGKDAAAAPAPSTPAAALSPRTVLDALDRLYDFRDEPSSLKQELLALSRRLGADARAGLRAVDEDTVDLVGMVFDFVRHDPVLPKPLQPLIARLQVPFLKAALSDPDLMKATDHPARQLIDELGEVALGWTPSTDPEGQLLTRLMQVVESLMQPQMSARELFERAITDLRGHLESGRHRAELAEQRAVEAALGRERLRIARSRVAATLERRLGRYTPLPWIRQLLRGPWANYLVLLWLRQGETSQAYRDALNFVDELLWCDEHGANSTDEARLRADEEHLEEDLRQGLSTVAYHDQEIERLVAELRQFIQSLRRRRNAPAFLYEIDPKLGTSDFTQTWAEHELEDQPDMDRVDPAVLARLRSLAPGTWFELGGREPRERAKLSWTSPFSGRCLFVNRNGLRVDEVSQEKLAEDIERGMTQILEGTRLLQRALQTLLERMRPAADAPQQSA